MAKKSAIEKNKHRRELVKKFAGRRERLLAVANDESKSMEERFEARLKLAELPRNCEQDPYPQPLRDHGPSACVLPQARHVAHRSARARHQGPDSWPREVQLVRGST